MKQQIKPFTPVSRFCLILTGLLLLQLNVPVPRAVQTSWSAHFTFNRPKVDTLQSFELLVASLSDTFNNSFAQFEKFAAENINETTEPKTFKIVKVESHKKSGKTEQDFIWPVKGPISSGFGMRLHPVTSLRSFHNGIDIKARRGTKIVAPEAGTVIVACQSGLMGRMVKLETAKGQLLYFGHLSKILCKKGQKVTKGQTLGTVGSSGRATGPHLHFSVQSSGKFINPIRLLSPLK